MADIYVRSTTGSDANNGSTWALAKATLVGATTIEAAGDTIFISQAHSETNPAQILPTFTQNLGSPVRVICGNDAAQPPTAIATSGTIATTGSSNIQLVGGAHFVGLIFNCGSGASGPTLRLNANTAGLQRFENCAFRMPGTGAGQVFLSNSSECKTTLKDCSFFFGSVNASIVPQYGNNEIIGGFFESGTATPIRLFEPISGNLSGSTLKVDGLDFSNLSAGVHLFRGGDMNGNHTAVLRNCRLPAGWTGSLIASPFTEPGMRIEMWNCDDGDTNYRVWIADSGGEIKQNTAIFKDAFAGGTKHSLAFTGASTCNELNRLVGPDLFADNTVIGSAVTATVEIVTNNVTLTDGECWLELMHMGTNGVPLGTWVADCKADILAAATAQTSSSESWTAPGITPLKQKLSVTFTPREAGYVIGRVVLTKASTTVYVDPQISLT